MSFFKKFFNKKPLVALSQNSPDSLLLYKELCGSSNFIYSPYSIINAVGMAYAGAKGDTREELADFFGEELLELQCQPKPRNDKNLKLQIANSVFPDLRFKIVPDYSKILEKTYAAECHLVDYVNDRKGAQKIINTWVVEKTDNCIQNLVNETNLSSDSRLVIVNAVYFNCKWENKFDVNETFDEDFYSDDKTVECPMMNKMAKYSYTENESFQAIDIPYKGGVFSMLVFLPVKGVSLSEFEKQFDFKLIQNATRNMKTENVILTLPKFKQESTMRMSNKLKALGINSMFTYGKADFSGIDGTNELFVGEIIQKAFIEVEEEGTKAAAATALVSRCGSPMTEEPKVFNANHPFLYTIMDNKTSTVLFAGKVVNPLEN